MEREQDKQDETCFKAGWLLFAKVMEHLLTTFIFILDLVGELGSFLLEWEPLLK